MMQDIEENNICEICGEEIEKKSYFKLKLYNTCNNSSFWNRKICNNCIIKKLGIPKERIDFYETLEYFKKNNKIKWYDKWDKKQIKKLVELLIIKKIPIINYGIPLYFIDTYKKENEIYLHEIPLVKEMIKELNIKIGEEDYYTDYQIIDKDELYFKNLSSKKLKFLLDNSYEQGYNQGIKDKNSALKEKGDRR
jgi:hypothetical protein